MITTSIVTYKTEKEELVRALNSVLKSSVERLYIIDNSPEDNLREIVKISEKIEYIFGHGNIGYGAAHNIAIKRSIDDGAKYHIVMNPDIYFKEGVVEELALYMDSVRDAGQVMPKVLYPNGEIQNLCKLLPSPFDLIVRGFKPFKGFVKRSNDIFEMSRFSYDRAIEIPFLSGCFMFLRCEALAKIEGFDDKFFMYCEDIDLCRRVGIAGYKTLCYPYVSIVHKHKKESFKSIKMMLVHIRSAITYFNKWGWLFDSYRRKVNREANSQFFE